MRILAATAVILAILFIALIVVKEGHRPSRPKPVKLPLCAVERASLSHEMTLVKNDKFDRCMWHVDKGLHMVLLTTDLTKNRSVHDDFASFWLSKRRIFTIHLLDHVMIDFNAKNLSLDSGSFVLSRGVHLTLPSNDTVEGYLARDYHDADLQDCNRTVHSFSCVIRGRPVQRYGKGQRVCGLIDMTGWTTIQRHKGKKQNAIKLTCSPPSESEKIFWMTQMKLGEIEVTAFNEGGFERLDDVGDERSSGAFHVTIDGHWMTDMSPDLTSVWTGLIGFFNQNVTFRCVRSQYDGPY